MGIQYYFACLDCNVVYNLYKQDNAERFIPKILWEHGDHQHVCVSDLDYNEEYNPTINYNMVDHLYPCNFRITLKNPTYIDCCDEPFYSSFLEWEKREKERKKRRKELANKPVNIPETWYKD